jgi:hypothetical protein
MRGAGGGRLLAPGCTARLPSRVSDQWHFERTFIARYSGGAAPALHRISVSPDRRISVVEWNLEPVVPFR